MFSQGQFFRDKRLPLHHFKCYLIHVFMDKTPKPLLITEIFHSIQGEGAQMGLPFVFVRLSGCNLRCTYCDTTYAFKGGTFLNFQNIMEKIRALSTTKNVLITGGEPLLQRSTNDLIRFLLQNNFKVSLETHGEHSIENVPHDCHIIMDIKTPGSGMCRMGFLKNLKYLKPTDEIKIVITSKEDYLWANDIVKKQNLPTKNILYSPALQAKNTPGKYAGVNPQWLAEEILNDQLPVRFQIQLHKILWENSKGR